jgi:hypothetical protein
MREVAHGLREWLEARCVAIASTPIQGVADLSDTPERPREAFALVKALVSSFAALVLAGCHHPTPAPLPPAEPIPAEPPEPIGTMVAECDVLLGALTSYRDCPNLDDDERAELDAWIDRAKLDIAAGEKANAPAGEQREIAGGCHRATHTVKDAHTRCKAGPTPKVE